MHHSMSSRAIFSSRFLSLMSSGNSIMLTDEELAALEKWRFEKRMPSRSAAVRELLRRGLASDGFLTAEVGVKSQDFGMRQRRKSCPFQGLGACLDPRPR